MIFHLWMLLLLQERNGELEMVDIVNKVETVVRAAFYLINFINLINVINLCPTITSTSNNSASTRISVP